MRAVFMAGTACVTRQWRLPDTFGTESPWHSLDETVAVMETIDDARRQVAAQAGGCVARLNR